MRAATIAKPKPSPRICTSATMFGGGVLGFQFEKQLTVKPLALQVVSVGRRGACTYAGA
jgi:hypothetical protein